ncbi:RNA polymerase sigma-B factor [Marmoricola sp. OAE513]|uniref:sigma-70 family RNA polymerase sigma factor n=1 Tax=Marmoricola sp. OAE513 TaxID=2817894 RepID=UPI001AE8BBA0
MPTATDSSLPVTDVDVDHRDRSTKTRELFEQVDRCTDPLELERLHHEIVILNLGVADALASRYGRRGLDSEDLNQVARLALVRIVPKFRSEFGRDFLAYAVPSILGALRKHFRDTGWTVRPPRRVQEAHQAIAKARPQLVQELGREPTISELCAETGVDEETALEALEVNDCYSPASLDAAVRADAEGSEATLGAFLGADDPDMERSEARAMLRPLVAKLKPRDQRVLELRFVHGLTQSEVGEEIGVSQMQVSRIQSRILSTLRSELGELTDAMPTLPVAS